MLTQGGPQEHDADAHSLPYNNYRDPGKSMGYTIAGALLVMLVIALINSLIITLVKSEKKNNGGLIEMAKKKIRISSIVCVVFMPACGLHRFGAHRMDVFWKL